MPLDARKRSKILTTAIQWLGTPYDESHTNRSWKEPAPSAFDCSTFVCRVAIDALGYAPQLLAANAEWLLDNLVEVEAPEPGDLVGYGRAADADEYLDGHDAVWHVMIYLGAGTVIGACDIAGSVTTRPFEYESEWKLVDPPPFRALELRPQSAPVALASLALKKRRA